MRSRKRGLDAFEAAEGDGKRFCDRPLLTLHYDERSPNLAAGQWLLNKQMSRVCLVRDVFHREWNDCKLALQSCKL